MTRGMPGLREVEIDKPSHIVTAAELVRSFAHWRQVALNNVVHVTNHGRETHVLMSREEFTQLAGAQRQAIVSDPRCDTCTQAIAGLAEWLDEALIVINAQFEITFANRVAHAICRRGPADMINHKLLDALPEAAGSLLEVHMRRTVASGEPTAADFPSPFAPAAWLRMQSFPLGNNNVVLLTDITSDVERHRLADEKASLAEAIRAHGEISSVRVSVRGTIDGVDQPFCQMVDLSEERLLAVSFLDLVDLGDRVAVREALESVMRDGEPKSVSAHIITNHGATRLANMSIVQLHGIYGAEGAIILLTASNDRQAA